MVRVLTASESWRRHLRQGLSENAVPEAEPEPDDAEDPGRSMCRMVLIFKQKYRSLAIRPLTQTAPDEESEAE
ncbi:hypothetical protein QFZ22_005863 [Streptomyces canus]|uniref:Uncharacterized protein n=1 Tax=Streptomyces canus TaxID=58343 RepID=A0AAW8FM22_9ACTN|nr:hypothetical protein [Streptomyces canus]